MEVLAERVNSFKFVTIFAKSSILDAWQDFKFASEASDNFAEKSPSQMLFRVLNLYLQPLIIFTKMLAICLLNFIKITVLRLVKSTGPYFQHSFIIVFPNHVFLKTFRQPQNDKSPKQRCDCDFTIPISYSPFLKAVNDSKLATETRT